VSVVSEISLEIVGAGLNTVLGSGCLAAAMMARALRFSRRHTELRYAQGKDRVRMGIVETLPSDLFGVERLVALCVPALVEAAEGALAARGSRGPLPVWLALPEAGRSDDDARLSGEVIDLLMRASGVAIDRARSGVVRLGRAGAAEAVERAAALWSVATAPAAVLVGGVDSVYHPEVVKELSRRAVEGAPPEVTWSEGAAFVALAPPGAASGPKPQRAGARIRVTGAEIWQPDLLARKGEEAARLLAETDFVAVRVEQLRRLTAAERAGWVLADVNGDPKRAIEWWDVAHEAGLADAAQDLPAERFGDVGAATGPASMAIAWTWWRAGCGRAPRALVSLASDGGACGAIALEADLPERG
jgi:3-oxoacyl-[acyl-carrier-protein] synthase-1